jgi:hypothetical protein
MRGAFLLLMLCALISLKTALGGKKGESGSTNPISNLGNSLTRLVNGVKQAPTQIREVNLLKKRVKAEGDGSLTYSEYKFLERSKDDFMKCVRLGLTASVSPELFFYSYIVVPAISVDNPWAWVQLPSAFDNEKEQGMRNRIKIKRRQHAVMRGMTNLMENSIDDAPAKMRAQRMAQMERVKLACKALSGKSFDAAIGVLEPYYTATTTVADNGSSSNNKNKNIKKAAAVGAVKSNTKRMLHSRKKDGKQRIDMCLDGLPWVTVKDACKSFGFDGLPNIFVLRRLNKGELSKHFDTIRKADEHLDKIGVQSLTDTELADVCMERCISIDNTRSTGELRKDVGEWLSLVQEPPTSKEQYNDQNLRLIMAGLHTVKGARRSRFGSGMKSLLQD